MNTTAIERIKGFCCEVNEQQWKELVRVADEVGMPVDEGSRINGTEEGMYQIAVEFGGKLYTVAGVSDCDTEIYFHVFLARLKGGHDSADPFTAAETLEMARKEWTPKAGEMVEVPTVSGWKEAEYMCHTHGRHWVFMRDSPWDYTEIRPLRPTLTRAEAEEKLNCRITD